jgi:hypothetical protein
VRIKVAGGLVADGPRTKSLASYGKQDGQSHLNVRPLLGSYHQNGVKRGEADIALVPTGAASQVTELEKQIISTLTAFEKSMRAKLQPWITEWANKGWKSVPEAKRQGQLKGLSTWWESEVDFWSSVSHVAQDVWKGIKSGASTVADWYDDLPWYEKINPLVTINIETWKLAKKLWDHSVKLWDRREQVMNLLKAFLTGTADAIENGLAALVDLPGELGALIKALVKDSAEWVQNMIEVARNTDVFRRATNTIMSIVMMMTPNFWAEGIGLVEGYLLPEVLITIALIIIGALCTAAGASALAARVAGMLSKLRKAIAAAGKTGEVLTTLFSKLDDLAELIGKLSKALRSRIEELHKGATDQVNRILRRVFHETWPNAKARKLLEKLEELNKKTPADAKEKAAITQEKKVLSEQLGNEAAKNQLRNQLGKNIPDSEIKTFEGPHVVNLYYKDPSTGKVYVMEAKGGKSQLGTRVGRHGELLGRTLNQGTPEYLEDVATQMTVNGAKNTDKIKAGQEILSAMRKDNYEYIIVRGGYDPKAPLGNPIPPEVITPKP